MKEALLRMLLAVFILPLFSFEKDSLLNHPMPLLPNKTLDGKTIDENYYKGHVTVVSFMFIGCMPCMKEISTLNRIQQEYLANGSVRVLCVARQMRGQMIEFNEDTTAILGHIRKAMDAGKINYTIQPGCDDDKSKMEIGENGTTIKSECNTLENTFGFSSYPELFFVDKKGLIRKIKKGGPIQNNDPELYDLIKKEVDLLLSE